MDKQMVVAYRAVEILKEEHPVWAESHSVPLACNSILEVVDSFERAQQELRTHEAANPAKKFSAKININSWPWF